MSVNGPDFTCVLAAEAIYRDYQAGSEEGSHAHRSLSVGFGRDGDHAVAMVCHSGFGAPEEYPVEVQHLQLEAFFAIPQRVRAPRRDARVRWRGWHGPWQHPPASRTPQPCLRNISPPSPALRASA